MARRITAFSRCATFLGAFLAMELKRTPLFEIPLWTTEFEEIVPYHDEMAREVETLIDSAPAEDPPRYLAHQTASDPFQLPSPGWRMLEQSCNRAYAELAKRHFQRWRTGEFHLRRWAIRFGRLSKVDKERLARDAMHNHLPALFSSIYYLRVPAAFVEQPEGGTLFTNPIGNLMDFMSPRTKTVAPKEGRFVVFPSFVDHAPIPFAWDAEDTTRIVVSCDVFYVSGESGHHGSMSVIKAEADR